MSDQTTGGIRRGMTSKAHIHIQRVPQAEGTQRELCSIGSCWGSRLSLGHALGQGAFVLGPPGFVDTNMFKLCLLHQHA